MVWGFESPPAHQTFDGLGRLPARSGGRLTVGGVPACLPTPWSETQPLAPPPRGRLVRI